MKTDAHIHILPGMDSGPARIGMAAGMFDIAYRAGIRCMVATPHYFCDRETVSEFLVRRRASLGRLREAVGAPFRNVSLLLSSEAMLMPGISTLDGLHLLTVPGTNLLPVVFPPSTALPPVLIREVAHMVQKRGICPLYCHTERYYSLFGEKFEEFLLMKHATFLVSPRAFSDDGLVLSLLRAIRHGARIFLGSNGHDNEARSPLLLPPQGSARASFAFRIISEMTDDFFASLKSKRITSPFSATDI